MRLFGGTRTALDAARTVHAAGDTSILPPAPLPAYTITASDIPGLVGGWFSRDTAMMVPAFTRGLEKITGVAAGFPLVELNRAGEPMQPLGFTAAPGYEAGIPRVTTIRQTVADLVCEGRAYWLVVQADANLYPRTVKRYDPQDVTRNPDGSYLVHGTTVPETRMIDFATGLPGALEAGWYTLRTALALEAAANNYANDPLPAIILRSTGIDLDEDDATALLGAWRAARQQRSAAYMNSQVEADTVGWTASELQLVEARQHSAAEVARLLNLDPVHVGANASGQSLTYQNKQDQNQAFLDETIMPLLRVIEQRLSMLSDGRMFRFDVSAFLRANLGERVSAFTQYIAAGVMTADEVRALEPLIRRGDVPE